MSQADDLCQFCDSLGIDRALIKQAESLPRYHLLATVPASDVRSLSLESLRSLCESFLAALNLSIGLPGGPQVLEIEGGELPSHAAVALNRVKDISGSVEIDLTLDKQALLMQHDLAGEAYTALLYIFEENLRTALDAGLPEVDEHICHHRHKRTIILLLEGDAYYRGELLVIATPAYLSEIVESKQSIDPSLRSRVDRYHQVALDELNWVGFQFAHLTPLHFLCTERNEAADRLSSIIRRHLLRTTVLYTATRSVRKGGRFVADYASPEQTVSLALTDDSVPEDKSASLVRFALWPYTSAKTDRLTILQSVVARELQTPSSEQNYQVFIQCIGHILHQARWNHRVYITGEIDRHFEQVQKAADYVSAVAGDISAAIDNITKGLTEALLATIGVIITSFIAALVEEDLSVFLFELGMRIYAVYVVVQLLYRMSGILYSHQVLNKNAREQLQAYEDVLGQDKVADILSPVKRRNLQFYIWFVVTVVLYVGLAIATWKIGGGFTPSLVEEGMLSPIATPTGPPSTATPAP